MKPTLLRAICGTPMKACTLRERVMKKLRIGIIDIVSKGPTRALYARIMNASLASIMPQVIGVWCKEEGHDVTFVCYTGFEDLLTELPDNVDVVFIGAFTEAAHTAYALSSLFRGRGAITAIGGLAVARVRTLANSPARATTVLELEHFLRCHPKPNVFFRSLR